MTTNMKDLQASKSATRSEGRDTLIDWGRVGDALRTTGQRVGDAALDAAFDRPAPAPPPAPIIVRDAPAPTNTALYVLLGLGIVALGAGLMRR
jgi:hypothetical protein